MRHSIFRPVQLLFAFLVAITPLTLAQVSTGTIAGNVSDSTGAAVPNATVLVTNTATGVVTRAVTGNSGFYNAPNLQPGPYSVSVSMPGFSQQIVRGIELTVGAQNETNFVLKVGAASEKVEVTSAPPLIDLVTSTTMPVVNQRTIVDLPLT